MTGRAGTDRTVSIERLTASAFAPFGEVLEAAGEPDRIINQGLCRRFHDRAALDFPDGRAGISLFDARPRTLPLTLDMMERHPLGSQAFVPMTYTPFLVIVAEDAGGAPGTPRAFLTAPGQGVNYRRNVWHGVLTPLAPLRGRADIGLPLEASPRRSAPGLFAVIDRIGDGDNLEEHWFDEPWTVTDRRRR